MSKEPAVAHEAYTGALLHDIGKLALAVNLEEQYRQALETAKQKNVPVYDVEQEVFGATHAQAGAYLLSLWGLPARVIEAVARHHRPARELSGEFSAVTAVHLANALEYAETSARSGFPEFRLDLDYPKELRIQENIEQFREVVRHAARPVPGRTQFIRKPEAQPITESRPAADAAPHGWWSRFRDLLAA